MCRSLRPDRTKQAAQTFVQNVLGDRYVAPLNMSFEELVLVSDSKTPIILMLSPGADPTQTLEDLAKRKNLKIYPVSMGEVILSFSSFFSNVFVLFRAKSQMPRPRWSVA